MSASTTYYYRVRAANDTIYSSYSNEASATTTSISFSTPLCRGGAMWFWWCIANDYALLSPVCSSVAVGYMSPSSFDGAIPLYRGGTFSGSCVLNTLVLVAPVAGCLETPIGYMSPTNFDGAIPLYQSGTTVFFAPVAGYSSVPIGYISGTPSSQQ